jgi:di/tricarboxylate transporter
MNNTLVVSVAINTLYNNRNVSKILLPISYISIIGGTCTLIGTSTNLIINSFVIESNLKPLKLFDFAYVGIPLVIVGILYIIFFSRKLLPETPQKDEKKDSNYFLEAKVLKDSNLIGKTVKENRLRNLESLFLTEILRGNDLITPVSPDEEIKEGDLLIFTGEISNIKDLQKFKGLQVFEEESDVLKDNLVWVVLSHRSDLTGKKIKDSHFRSRFDAAVVAVKRGQKKLTGKIGNIKLQAGDYLILATGDDFYKKDDLLHENFYSFSKLHLINKLNRNQTLIVLLSFFIAILCSAIGLISLFNALIILMFFYFFMKILNVSEMRSAFNIDLLLLIGSALGIAKVLIDTGTAKMISDQIIMIFGSYGVYGSFIGIYLLTVIFTEIITNNAAAALVFPIAYSTAMTLGVDPLPFIMAVVYGASASFITPYGYQTNLMVFSTGNYKPVDFLKFGLPLSIVYSIVVIILVPVFFKF